MLNETPLSALPPLVSGAPVVGVLPALAYRPLEWLLETRRRMGDIFTLDLGFARWVVVLHPRHAEHVLVSHCDRYRKTGPAWEALTELLGTGLALSEGEAWKRQRRVVQPYFHRQQMAALTSLMIETIAETLDSWQGAADSGKPFNLSAGYSGMAMRVVARTLFGQGLPAAEVERVGALIAHIADYLPLGILGRALPPWAPIPGAGRYRRKLRELDAMVHKIIAGERGSAAPSGSLLARMVAETGDGGLTDGELRDEVMTFLLAGADPTSLALSWASHFLIEHPEVASQVEAEVDAVLGRRAPLFADAAALSYTRMVIQESLRLRPPDWWLPRSAAAEDEIDGFRIPAGTMVVLMLYGIHHNPTVWPDPERFRPERFAREEVAQRHKHAWIPFGAGPRACMGREFALIEAQLALAMLLQRFSLSAAPGRRPSARARMTLRPEGGVQVYLRRRT